MKLAGIELRNFRSIGDKPVALNPLNGCNILVGQNNAGKSNVLRAIKKISDRFQKGGENVPLEDLEFHNRDIQKPFGFKLFFETDKSLSSDVDLAKVADTDKYWFTFSWGKGSPPRFIPVGFYIPEFRQITHGSEYRYDGQNLVSHLAQYHTPIIGKDMDQEKFEKIQDLVRKLLHLPDARIEFAREEPSSPTLMPTITLIVNNNGLRLPLSYYGTGVHELIIMITAVLSKEQVICCIEEPEIHLHPRLQRALIEALVAETSNQYFITTHSPTLLNSLATITKVSLFHLKIQEDETVGGLIDTGLAGIQAIKDLGLKPSDLLQANSIIWVEGPSDRVYIQRWLELFAPGLCEGRDYIFMCYSQMQRLSIEADAFINGRVNVLKLNPNAIVVGDSDKGKEDDMVSEAKKEMVRQCEDNGGIGWITSGREIENYLSPRTIVSACKELRNANIEISFGRYEDFEKVIDAALQSQGAKPLQYGDHKLDYSRKFAEHISKEDIGEELKEQLSLVVEKISEWNR